MLHNDDEIDKLIEKGVHEARLRALEDTNMFEYIVYTIKDDIRDMDYGFFYNPLGSKSASTFLALSIASNMLTLFMFNIGKKLMATRLIENPYSDTLRGVVNFLAFAVGSILTLVGLVAKFAIMAALAIPAAIFVFAAHLISMPFINKKAKDKDILDIPVEVPTFTSDVTPEGKLTLKPTPTYTHLGKYLQGHHVDIKNLNSVSYDPQQDALILKVNTKNGEYEAKVHFCENARNGLLKLSVFNSAVNNACHYRDERKIEEHKKALGV